MTEVMINVYAACPYGLSVYKPKNELSVTFEPEGLLQYSVEGFCQSHNPSICEYHSFVRMITAKDNDQSR
jgi:hypothetical protein